MYSVREVRRVRRYRICSLRLWPGRPLLASPHTETPSTRPAAAPADQKRKKWWHGSRLALQGTLIPWQLEAEADLALELTNTIVDTFNQVKTNGFGPKLLKSEASPGEGCGQIC